MCLNKVANLEEWIAHLYTESLCLVAACYGTAVVVREHDDGTSLKVGAEDSLTRDKKVVAVGEGKHVIINSLFSRLYLLYYICHHAPYLKLAVGIDAYRLKVGVGCNKLDMIIVALYALEGELAIYEAHR